jgi:hypothetical protein
MTTSILQALNQVKRWYFGMLIGAEALNAIELIGSEKVALQWTIEEQSSTCNSRGIILAQITYFRPGVRASFENRFVQLREIVAHIEFLFPYHVVPIEGC